MQADNKHAGQRLMRAGFANRGTLECANGGTLECAIGDAPVCSASDVKASKEISLMTKSRESTARCAKGLVLACKDRDFCTPKPRCCAQGMVLDCGNDGPCASGAGRTMHYMRRVCRRDGLTPSSRAQSARSDGAQGSEPRAVCRRRHVRSGNAAFGTQLAKRRI